MTRAARSNSKGSVVADVFVVLFLVGFFALCLGYVRACDWIVGPDSEAMPDGEDADVPASEQPAG